MPGFASLVLALNYETIHSSDFEREVTVDGRSLCY
ncbi:hypothetical protein OROGR_012845 [Orobanche gracilis]